MGPRAARTNARTRTSSACGTPRSGCCAGGCNGEGRAMFDVVQVGMGPVGLTMAGLLAQAGHTVAVIERHAALFGLPRAGHIDHEIVRILQSLDCEGPVLADS